MVGVLEIDSIHILLCIFIDKEKRKKRKNSRIKY